MTCKDFSRFLLRFFSYWLKRVNATAFDGVKTERVPNKIEVLHYLLAAVDTLDNDAGKGLPEKAWAMKYKAEPVKENLHDGGNLERVIWGCKDDSIRRHDLLYKEVPLVLQLTELLSFVDTQFAASASPDLVVAQHDNFVLDVTQRLQILEKL